jgi:Trp operon repressor
MVFAGIVNPFIHSLEGLRAADAVNEQLAKTLEGRNQLMSDWNLLLEVLRSSIWRTAHELLFQQVGTSSADKTYVKAAKIVHELIDALQSALNYFSDIESKQGSSKALTSVDEKTNRERTAAAKQGSAYKKGRDGGDSRGERDREDIRCKCGACGKSDRMYQDCKDSQAKKRLAREVHKNPDKYPHGLKKLVLEEFKQPPKTPSSSPRRSKSSSQLRRSSPAAAAKPDEGQQQRQEAATAAQEQAAEAELPFGVNFENSDSEDLEQSANGFSSS